jgi:hypothetical protein
MKIEYYISVPNLVPVVIDKKHIERYGAAAADQICFGNVRTECETEARQQC